MFTPCLRRGCSHDITEHRGQSGVCTRNGCQCFRYAHDTKPAYERLRN